MANTHNTRANFYFLSQAQAHRFLLLGGLLVGFALRLYQLGAESLWYDETVSVVLARKSISGLLAHTAGDIHPPGYYLLLHFWQMLSKPTLAYGLEFLFAWPSLCFGVVILALLYPLAHRLVDARVALLALWLGAINPFHIWYSQEVRMYTLGAALGLLCLWALVLYFTRSSASVTVRNSALVIPLLVYAMSAAAGLYTLYYFAFLLIGLNAIALWLWHKNKRASANRAKDHGLTPSPPFLYWLSAQVGVLLLWLPWLPIFWRQATDPPVPPWRTAPDSLSALLRDVNESLSVLLAGQSAPLLGGWQWGWAVIMILILAWRYRTGQSVARHSLPSSTAILIVYSLLPLALLHLLTATVTPLYFVRYVFTYAPPFMILLAMVVLQDRHRQGWMAVARMLPILLLSGVSLYTFWTDPAYRADDHRAAVAQLAANWRPGDAILVNAGWAYTVLETYWPTEVADVAGAVPPPLTHVQRLTTLDPSIAASQNAAAQTRGPYFERPPIVWRTGSVDGSPNLGWGSPESDFFAMSTAETMAALDTLSRQSARIWHYRLYDTVNDPHALIRQLLAQSGTLRWEMPYPGRDFLRVQLFEEEHDETVYPSGIGPSVADRVDFGDVLRLESHNAPATRRAGEMLYVDLQWRGLPGLMALTSDLSMSLRFYDDNGLLLSQQDASPWLPTSAWLADHVYWQPLALPIPVSAQPGLYQLVLIAYQQDDGAPLPLAEAERVRNGQRWLLNTVELLPALRTPPIPSVLARFDYIDLVQATVGPAEVCAGESVQVELIWRPRPNAYSDTYTAVLALRNSRGEVVQTWSELAGSQAYPSGAWLVEVPVRDLRMVTLSHEILPGAYALTVHLTRTSDGLAIAGEMGWWRTAPFVPIQDVVVCE